MGMEDVNHEIKLNKIIATRRLSTEGLTETCYYISLNHVVTKIVKYNKDYQL